NTCDSGCNSAGNRSQSVRGADRSGDCPGRGGCVAPADRDRRSGRNVDRVDAGNFGSGKSSMRVMPWEGSGRYSPGPGMVKLLEEMVLPGTTTFDGDLFTQSAR